MRIFINHVNTYSGVALARTLRTMNNVLNRLFGTAEGSVESTGGVETAEQNEKRVAVPSCIRRLISKRNPQQLLQNLLNCSLAVFDLHNSDPEELEFLFKKLKGAQLQQPLCVVLISSVLTWAKTRRQYVRDPPEDSEGHEGEAEGGGNGGSFEETNPQSSSPSPADAEGAPANAEQAGGAPAGRQLKPGEEGNLIKKPQIFSGDNFQLRSPSEGYEKWKMVETLLMSLNSKENFRGFVVAAGMMYLEFRAYGSLTWLRTMRSSQSMRRSSELTTGTDSLFYAGETIFYQGKTQGHAWPQTELTAVRQLLFGCSLPTGAGNNFVPTVHLQDVCSLVRTLALDASNTGVFYHLAVDGAFATQRHILEAVVHELGCPFEVASISEEQAALLERADILTQDLRFECSPVMKDSSFQWHAKEGFVKLIKQIAAEFCQWRGLRQLKILVTVAAEDTKRKGSKKPGARRARLDAETMAKLFTAKLTQNICRFRGFVLDGFPKSYEECKALFLKPKAAETTADSAEGEDGGEEANEAGSHSNTESKLNSLIVPDFVISISASLETCEKRLMALHPSAVLPSHNDREGFKRRYQIFVQQNESVEGRPRTTDFFQERGIEVLTLPTDGKGPEDLLSSCVIYISRWGPIRNFLLESTDWLAEREQALKEQEAQQEEAEQEREARERREEEQELQKQRERDLARLRRIADYEQQLLLTRSIPLRRYLMQHVIPTLSEGLLEICRVLPEDPVSYLTAFLFAKARQIE
ncbi:hypothetical protein Efla_001138 [Eimeria flavescens]